jgi:cytochrome c553
MRLLRNLAPALSAFLALFASSQPASSAPPAEANSCLACHGAQGEGLAAAGYPRLAGLSAEYISEQLNAYIDGRRVNPIMRPMAMPLTATQIQGIATFFSALPAPSNVAAALTDATQSALGQQLAERGEWSAGIPACFNCHAPGGVGLPPAFPPIVGQPAMYIESQIQAWKNGTRQGDPKNLANALMHNVAFRMSDTQTKAVAAWLAAQPIPTPNTSPSTTVKTNP